MDRESEIAAQSSADDDAGFGESERPQDEQTMFAELQRLKWAVGEALQEHLGETLRTIGQEQIRLVERLEEAIELISNSHGGAPANIPDLHFQTVESLKTRKCGNRRRSSNRDRPHSLPHSKVDLADLVDAYVCETSIARETRRGGSMEDIGAQDIPQGDSRKLSARKTLTSECSSARKTQTSDCSVKRMHRYSSSSSMQWLSSLTKSVTSGSIGTWRSSVQEISEHPCAGAAVSACSKNQRHRPTQPSSLFDIDKLNVSNVRRLSNTFASSKKLENVLENVLPECRHTGGLEPNTHCEQDHHSGAGAHHVAASQAPGTEARHRSKQSGSSARSSPSSRTPPNLSCRSSPTLQELLAHPENAEQEEIPDRPEVAKRGDTSPDAVSEDGVVQQVSSARVPISPVRSIRKSRIGSMDYLRTETEMQILGHDNFEGATQPSVGMADTSSFRRVVHVMPNLVFRLSGILPFASHAVATFYTAIVFTAFFAMLSLSVIVLVMKDDDSPSCMHIATMCLAAGNFFALCSMRLNGIQGLVGSSETTLEMYADHYGFILAWLDDSALCTLPIMVLWFVGVVARIFTMTDCPGENRRASQVALILYVIVSGLFAMLTYCQVHIASGLEMMVEGWCRRFFHNRNVDDGIVQWNTLQAVLRRTASIIESCIFLMQTSLLGSLVVVGVEILDSDGLFASGDTCAALWGLSVLLPVIMSLFASFRAATVTEKCMRVPSLLNSIAVDFETHGLDASCFKLVDYITNSAAGFYVKGVRLTAFMVVKIVYLLGAVVLTLIMQIRRNA